MCINKNISWLSLARLYSLPVSIVSYSTLDSMTDQSKLIVWLDKRNLAHMG